MSRCSHCPVAAHLACPDAPWHCRAVADPDRARQVAVLAASKAVRQCPHKGPPGCSCNAFATCAIGKGVGGQVQHADCLACVGDPPETAA